MQPKDTVSILDAVKEDLAAIAGGPHRKVNPIRRAALLKNEFVEVALCPIGDIQQNPCHSDHLLRPVTMYIHRAPRQMVALLRTPTLPIHLF